MIANEEKIRALANLAKEADSLKNIDWDALPMKKDEVFLMMASNVVEQIDSLEEKDRVTVSMATITKLLVDNFVLNYQLKQRGSDV